MRNYSDQLLQIGLVHSRYLGRVDNRRPPQASAPTRQQRVARCSSESRIAGEDTDDDGVDATGVDLIALQHDYGMAISRFRATRFGEIHPVNLPSPNHR